MVLNVSGDGMAISMAIPVGDEAYSNLHVRMNGLAQSIEVHGRMAWTTKSKKRAGIQLVDVSDEQRGQIREWLAQEGVRDVNLLPRISEPAGQVLPVVAGAAISSKLLDEPRVNPSPTAASAATNPSVSAEPQASLLAGLGGTAPESLGPTQDEPSFSEDTLAESQSSREPKSSFVGFRENEWDLASITMVPRKKSKPEGLSALGLLLLWIAIPSFGIGIIVGRRPLERWLSHAAAQRKNISHSATPESEIANARDESPDITASDIDANGPQSIPARRFDNLATTNGQDAKTSAATKSFVSTPGPTDTKLLNSMSTQELRAFKSPAPTAPPENPSPNDLAKVDSKANLNAATKDAFTPKPTARADISAASTNARTKSGNASGQRGDSKEKSALAPATAHDTQRLAAHNETRLVQSSSKQNSSAQVANRPSAAPSNVAASHTSTSSVTSKVVPRTPSNSTGTIATASGTENSSTHQNMAGSTPATQTVGNVSTASTQSVNHSVTPVSGTAMNSAPTSSSVSDASRNNNTVSNASKTQPASASSTNATATANATTTPSAPAPPRPESRVASDATPRIASNVRPSMGSTSTPGPGANVPPSSYAASSSRPAAPSGATNLAPVKAQPALHGVMLVARKYNESFLLKLPVESVAGGRSVTVQMQRFVMMPAESRWHHHGPIAKLAVGELLTQVAANQLETASNARPGDAVTVRAFVDKNGSVRDLKPVSGRFGLMPRVMRDVREWQFDQTLIDGKPVESEVNITVEFRSGPQLSRSREIQAQNSFKP
jgi:PilZ domain